MKQMLKILVLAGFIPPLVLAGDDEFEALEQDIIKLALTKTKIDMKQAIETAAKEAGAAKLAEAELSVEGESPVFEFEFLTEGGAIEINVHAATGKILEKNQGKPDPDEAAEYQQTRKALMDVKVTLLGAIDAAMNEVKGGTVVAADADVENGKLAFEVLLSAADQFTKVRLDSDGKVIKSQVERHAGQAWIFETDEVGKTPPHWKFSYTNPADGKATWTIAKDPQAMSGVNVLTLEAKSGGPTYNLAMAEKTAYQDVDVRTRIRADSGKEDQGGGVIWRAKDENNYYIARINPLEGNFRVYKVVDGKRTQLQSADCSAESGRWHVVRAKMVGKHIQCFVDDQKLLDATDDTFKGAGMVGLWTKADASSSFDNFAVKPGIPSKTDNAPAKLPETAKDDDDDE